MSDRYFPEFFNTTNVQDAKCVILTPFDGHTVERRWTEETAWLADRIRFDDDVGLVIDYGCGIGRLAKVIKNPVLGVDISPTMRAQAIGYVERDEFAAVSPTMLETLSTGGLKASGAIAIWALQHVADPERSISGLMNALVPGSPFWLLDLLERRVPCLTSSGDVIYATDNRPILPIIDRWCLFESAEHFSLHRHEYVELRKYRKR